MKTKENVLTRETFEAYKKEQQMKNKIFIIIIIICLFLSGISTIISNNFSKNSIKSTLINSNLTNFNKQESTRSSIGASLVGSIYSYMGTAAPHGYLPCDGAIYNINDYPRLASHINNNFGKYNFFGGDGETTFAVPDLRGEFLRGSGTNSHTYGGTGANVGVHQAPTVSPYIISGSTRLSIYGNASPSNTDTTQGNSKLGYATASSPTDYTYAHFYTNRPTNTSILYIIKY